ncbi:MAG: hypothetical protein L6Q78_12040 [Bacteroidia bacterium]|nr:hypothetical protein [Bacteroidia bacterium]
MKNYLLLFFIQLIFGLSCPSIYGQTPFVENFEELSMGLNDQQNFGSNVNEGTGILHVKIPLLKAVSGLSGLDLSLTYSGKGVKVNQRSSRVGLGWQLSGIGSITKVVCGLNDNGANGYYQNVPSPGWRWQNASYPDINNFLKGFYLGTKDGQPDFFILNIGTSTVKFIKKGNQFVTFPKSSIKIDFGVVDGFSNSFRITDESGVNYSFTEKEYTRIQSGSLQNSESVSSWFLTKVQSPNGQVLTISYSDEYTYSVQIDQVETESRLLFRENCPSNLNSSNSTIEKYDYDVINIISHIRTKRPIQIDFNQHRFLLEYSDREDILGEKSLSKISHFISNSLFEGVVLNYFYRVKANGIGSGLASKRMMLASVQKFGKSLSFTQPSTNFYYNQIDLPSPGTPSQDLQGYFNNKTFSLVNPNGTFYSMLPSTSYRADVTGSAGYYLDDYPSLNRDPDLTFAKAMILEKIDYGTGKTEEFSYELNSSTSEPGYSLVQDGLRLKQLVTKSGIGDRLYTNYFYFNGRSFSRKRPNISKFLRPVTLYAVPPNQPLVTNYCQSLCLYRSSVLRDFSPNIIDEGVFYQKVRIINSADEACTVYKYIIEKEYQTNFVSTNFGGRFLFDPSIPGRLQKVTHYKPDGITKTFEEQFEYESNFVSNYDTLSLAFLLPEPQIYQVSSNSQDINLIVPSLTSESYLNAYQIDLLITFSKLKSTEKRRYFTTTSSSTEKVDFFFEPAFNEIHYQPIKTITTKFNGTIETNYYKFAGDFSIPNSVNNTSFSQALLYLRSSNRLAYPIEVVKTVRQGSGTEFIQAGSFFEYNVDPTSNHVNLARKFSLKQIHSASINNFVFSNYINGSILKSSNYYLESFFSNYTNNNNLNQLTNGNNHSSMIYDQFEDEIISVCDGCKTTEMAYVDFEDIEGALGNGTSKGNFLFSNSPGSSWPLAPKSGLARAGSYSLNISGITISFNGASLSNSQKYILRFWTRNGTSILKANSVSLTPTIIGVVDGWTLNEFVFTGGITVEISGNCLIDQIVIFREGAQISISGFDNYYQNVFVSKGGIDISRMEYDGLGRLSSVYDNEGNILKSFSYSIKEEY